MNRKKKIFTKLKAKDKKAKQKLAPKRKPKYIPKAERERLEQEQTTATMAEKEEKTQE